MATEEKKTETTFDAEKLKAKLHEIADYQNQFVGKPNMNPFLWIQKNVTPLLKRLDAGEKTNELALAINSLKKVEPIVNPNAPKVEPPKPPATVLTPTGLKFKE